MSGGLLKCLPTTPMMASLYVVGGALAQYLAYAACAAKVGGVIFGGRGIARAKDPLVDRRPCMTMAGARRARSCDQSR